MALSEKEKSALQQFKIKATRTLGNQLIEMKLFGSKARGDDRPTSDIDVLVIVDTEDGHIRDNIYEISTDILLQTDICISPKVISKNKFEQLCRQGTSFMSNVSRDAVTV